MAQSALASTERWCGVRPATTTNGLCWALQPPPLGCPAKVVATTAKEVINGSTVMVASNPAPRDTVLTTSARTTTPLIEAIRHYGHADTGRSNLRHLLRRVVELDFRNGQGNTALHGAVYEQLLTPIRWLVATGASIDVVNEQGQTPLALAKQMQQHHVVALLESLARLPKTATRGMPWSIANHHLLQDPEAKRAVETVLYCAARAAATPPPRPCPPLPRLPAELWTAILGFLFPIDLG